MPRHLRQMRRPAHLVRQVTHRLRQALPLLRLHHLMLSMIFILVRRHRLRLLTMTAMR
jgi:hypothetical protein